MTDAGGLMALDGTDLVCRFPADALPVESTTITVQLKLNAARGQATRVEMDFQPSMTFEEPVELIVANNYLAGTNRKYTLWFFDPQDRRWEKQDEEEIVQGSPIIFEIFHYSGYAVSR